MSPTTTDGGVVLSGGTGARLGGVDKALVRFEGRTMLDHALEALSAIDEVVVVGPPQATSRAVRFAREEPPLGGPAAGLLAGREALADRLGERVRYVVVLAVDMPSVTEGTVRRLLAAAEGHDGAFLVDGSGRRTLAGALLARRLDDVAPPPPERWGLSMHRLLEGLDLTPVPARGREAKDVDTPEDLV